MRSECSTPKTIGRGLAILVISGLLGATMVRLAPGFGLDERIMDARLSRQSIEAIEREHDRERNPLTFYIRFLGGLLRGQSGRSVVFGQPVVQLIAERAPTTIRTVAEGLFVGWAAAILTAIAGVFSRRPFPVLAGMVFSGSLLSIPSAVLATICLLLRFPPGIAIAAVVFPRVHPHIYAQLRSALVAPHVILARARGLSTLRIFIFHVLPVALLPLVALAGVSVALAFGASIPVEALADSPGLGQLAWRAALGRDLEVLVTVTLLLTSVTVLANVCTDLVVARFSRRSE
jgi:peptide/nickel transport system permease protein